MSAIDTAPRSSGRPTASRSSGRPVIVVTGGSGLLGSRLIERLVDDHTVVSLDLDGDPQSPAEAEFICTDLTSETSVDRAMRRVKCRFGNGIASVVHLAAYYDFDGEPSPLYQRITVDGTRRLLRSLRDLDVEQFVFSSTMLVHEPTEPGEPIDETSPIGAKWPYPASKVTAEAVIGEETDGVGQKTAPKTVVARLAGVYDEHGHSPPIANQIKRIHGRWVTSHLYPGDPDRGQSFVHRDDAVEALVRIVAARKTLPQAVELLIGEPETPGYREIQDLIASEIHGTDWSTWRIPEPVARLGAWMRERNPLGQDPFVKPWMVERASDHYELDISRAGLLLQWRPSHRLLDVIPEMIDQLRADPDRWYEENDLAPPRRHLAA